MEQMNQFSPNTANLFAGLSNATVFENGEFFKAGFIGTLRINKCLCKDTRAAGLAFIVEFEVMSSNNLVTPGPDNPAMLPDAPVGASRTWFQGMKDMAIALPACLEFYSTVLNVDLKAPNAMDLKKAIQDCAPRYYGQENALQSLFIDLETYNKQTKKNTNFTRHSWSPFDYAAMGMQTPDFAGLLRPAVPVYQAPPQQPYGYAPAPPYGGPPPGNVPAYGQGLAPQPYGYAQPMQQPGIQSLNRAPFGSPAPLFAPPVGNPKDAWQRSPDGAYRLNPATNNWELP